MVREIKAGGKTRPFLFAYRAIKQLNKDGVTNGLESLEKAAYWGFYFGAVKRGQTPDFEESVIEEWFEEDIALIGEISEVITEVMADFESATEGKKKPLNVSK
jgi:hypothetical protein